MWKLVIELVITVVIPVALVGICRFIRWAWDNGEFHDKPDDE